MHHIGILKYVLVVATCIVASLSAAAQIPGLINYNEKDGLKSSVIYRLSQDRNGFIWIGTDNGIFRFDGKEFRHFNEKDGLKNLDVLEVIPMENDDFFICSFLTDFARISKGKIITNDPELKKIRLFTDVFVKYDETRRELLAVSYKDPVTLYLYKDGRVQEVTTDIIYTAGNTTRFFGYEKGLLYYADSLGRFLSYDIKTRKSTIMNLVFPDAGFYIGVSGDVLLAWGQGTVDFYFRKNALEFQYRNSLPVKGTVRFWRVDARGRCWVATNAGGVWCLPNVLSGSNHAKPLLFLKDHLISDVCVDQDDNVWFSTKSNGLFFIGRQFFHNRINNELNGYTGFVNVLAGDATSLFWGDETGNLISKDGKEYIRIKTDSIRKSEVKGLYTNNEFIVAANEFSLHVYNRRTGKKYGSPLARNFKNVVPFDRDRVVLCTGGYAIVYNFRTHTDSLLFKSRCYSAAVYDKQNIFLGTEKGLFLVNTNNKTPVPVIDSGNIVDIKMLDTDLYLAATMSNGIFVFNRDGLRYNITEADGLISNNVKKIQVENAHTFWTCTNLGISRVQLKNRQATIQSFTRIDGLPSEKVNDCFIRHDSIYIGTAMGMGVYAIKDLLSQKMTALDKRVIITRVSTRKKDWYQPGGPVVLNPGDNSINFHLSFLDYISLGNVKYSYQLEGLDDEWKSAASSVISFNSLAPGHYLLKVRGIGYSGLQSREATVFAFTIQPYFWQTTWFKLLSAIALALLFFFAFRFIEKRIRKKKIQSLVYEKRVAELELQAIKAQINPHFIYNCLNSIQFLLYKKDYEKADSYLDVFSQMIRKTLHYSEKTFISIMEEIDYLKFYLNMEMVRSHNSFTYTIHTGDTVNTSFQIPSLLIQPFVENAVKHGVAAVKDREGHISVSFEFTEPFLIVRISDNGPGIAQKTIPAIPSGSFGMKLSAKRMDTFRQLFASHISMDIQSPADGSSGTVIQLTLIPV